MLRHYAKEYFPRLVCNHSFTAAMLSVRGLKETTGLVGLPVDPEGRKNLRSSLYEILNAIKVIPEHAGYRKTVEATVKHRLEAVESPASDEEVESKLEFQLEVLIKQSRDELGLIPLMAEWQPWDVPAGHKIPVEVEELVEDSAKTQPAPPTIQPPPPPSQQPKK